jgi:glucosamine kinase
MILIADGGSTKTCWCVLDGDRKILYFNTEGYNPYFVTSSYISQSLKKSLPPNFKANEVREISFYGAGCSPSTANTLVEAFGEVFPNASAYIEMDLLAAARALLFNTAGFAAILGTGTNTCIYDGYRIIQSIDSLGFILGDEGSGGSIGKKLLGDFIRGFMPENIYKKFRDAYQLSADEIINRIYTQPMANRFCAGFCPFVKQNINEQYCRDLVKTSFEELFTRLVSRYPNYQSYSFNCIGSIGYNFKHILEEVACKFNMQPGRIVESPMEELVNYHINIGSGFIKSN